MLVNAETGFGNGFRSGRVLISLQPRADSHISVRPVQGSSLGVSGHIGRGLVHGQKTT